jgi:hypothetical protein
VEKKKRKERKKKKRKLRKQLNGYILTLFSSGRNVGVYKFNTETASGKTSNFVLKSSAVDRQDIASEYEL